MKLSILIPSLYSRKASLSELLDLIGRQDSECLKHTEVLVSIDGKAKTIGQKRNELLASAKGEYVVFIDDDDVISFDYLHLIFEGVNKGVDHIGIAMLFQPNNGAHKLVLCSKDYAWEEKNNVYYRSAQHVCPIKASIAKSAVFQHTNFGEDKIYSEKINPLIQTEHLITTPIYFYKYVANKTT